MPTVVQFRRGTTAQNQNFTGSTGEISIDTQAGTLRVHNGIDEGGSNIASVSYVTSAISAHSANSIASGTSNFSIIASGGNIIGNVAGATITNIYSGGITLTGLLSATGTVTGGNLATSGTISATGNITGNNLIISGSIQDSAQLDIQTTAGNANIVLTPNGTGNVNISANIMPTANAASNIGSATSSFNTVFAKATSAQYADLAEMYQADSDYTPGTVLEFGGNNEVTVSTVDHSTAVAGIVSTDPAYLMNSGLKGVHIVAVALIGRVPCLVQGPVKKGSVLVAGIVPGTAMAIDNLKFKPGCVVGKAMEPINSVDVKTIEVAVGRL